MVSIHYDTIYSLENNKSLLSVKYLKQISDILEINLCEYDDYYRFAIDTPVNIRRLREKLKMTPIEFAKYIGTGRDYVYRWENGRTYISRKYYYKLMDKLS